MGVKGGSCDSVRTMAKAKPGGSQKLGNLELLGDCYPAFCLELFDPYRLALNRPTGLRSPM